MIVNEFAEYTCASFSGITTHKVERSGALPLRMRPLGVSYYESQYSIFSKWPLPDTWEVVRDLPPIEAPVVL